MTLLSDTAYHSFIGEVGALNTTTIRRLTRSRRHQLLAIARGAFLVICALAVGTALTARYVVGPDETVSAGREVRPRDIFAGYQPLLQHRRTVVLLIAACVENIGVNAMWTYYGAFYVHRYGFGADQVGWVSLAAGEVAPVS
jgi:predicted MFS family arabinose efflux permease